MEEAVANKESTDAKAAAANEATGEAIAATEATATAPNDLQAPQANDNDDERSCTEAEQPQAQNNNNENSTKDQDQQMQQDAADAGTTVDAALAEPGEDDDNTSSQPSSQPAQAATASQATNNLVEPTCRDCILGAGSAGHVMNELLHDFVKLECILWKIHERDAPTTHEDVKEACQKLMTVVQKGKPLELAGLKDVPQPFLRSQGRFLTRSEDNPDVFVVMEDVQVQESLSELLLQELKTDLDLTKSPYMELKDMVNRHKETESTAAPDNAAAETLAATVPATLPAQAGVYPKIVLVPDPRDAILLRRGASNADKLYESHMGNKFVFSLISQAVTTFTNSCDLRVEAALDVLRGLQDSAPTTTSGNANGSSAVAASDHVAATNVVDKMAVGTLPSPPPAAAAPTVSNQKARFLLRNIREDESVFWSVLDPADAALFALCFVFEVYLEKEIHLQNPQPCSIVLKDSTPTLVEHSTTVPVDNPTDLDVLFGRGGMTNAHSGNRRFRDIIALHRPDYIRALKMDKPAVARKIVKAIRRSGRFLKKFEDGKWRDVGDRVAAEKTSQGLRERSNAEKRQRSALREALRIRRQDMSEDGSKQEDDEGKLDDKEQHESLAKKQKTDHDTAAPSVPILNYVGAHMAVPLSLGMKDASGASLAAVAKREKASSNAGDGSTAEGMEIFTEGLPPNAVDEEGNILVTDHDILCGRGGLTNHHKGNKRFRDIVALHRPDYVRAPKVQKPSVARVIVRAIRNGDPPGRFIRKDEKTGKWIDIGDKKAAEKTSQALREKTNDERDKPKRDVVTLGQPTGVLLPNPASYMNPVTAAAFAVAGTLPTMVNETRETVAAPNSHSEEGKGVAVPATTETNPVVAKEETATEEGVVASVKDAEAIVELITGERVATAHETEPQAEIAAATDRSTETSTKAAEQDPDVTKNHVPSKGDTTKEPESAVVHAENTKEDAGMLLESFEI